MSFSEEKRQEIIDSILEEISRSDSSPSKKIIEQFGISRQTVHRYLTSMIKKEIVEVLGEGKNQKYVLKTEEKHLKFETKGLEEDVVWRRDVKTFLPEDLPKNVLAACNHVFTEILNNAIDHSEADEVFVILKQNALDIEFIIFDQGIGIFNKIQEALNLEDPRYSILELVKGKFTTDPSKHSGEGIFFSSRIFDSFCIESGKLAFISGGKKNWDILFDDIDREIEGTCISMKISKKSDVVVKEIFDEYSDDELYGFTKTHIPVKLMDYEGDSLVSRSQAKRLIERFNRFREVILDFEGVDEVGQAFADELFRVFRNEHPEVHLIPVCMNENVGKMINRALSHIDSD